MFPQITSITNFLLTLVTLLIAILYSTYWGTKMGVLDTITNTDVDILEDVQDKVV